MVSWYSSELAGPCNHTRLARPDSGATSDAKPGRRRCRKAVLYSCARAPAPRWCGNASQPGSWSRPCSSELHGGAHAHGQHCAPKERPSACLEARASSKQLWKWEGRSCPTSTSKIGLRSCAVSRMPFRQCWCQHPTKSPTLLARLPAPAPAAAGRSAVLPCLHALLAAAVPPLSLPHQAFQMPMKAPRQTGCRCRQAARPA